MATKAIILENIISNNITYNLPYQCDTFIECAIDDSGYARIPLTFLQALPHKIYVGDRKYITFNIDQCAHTTHRLAWNRYFNYAFPSDKGFSPVSLVRINADGKDVIHCMKGLVFDKCKVLQIGLYARYKVIDGMIDTSEYVLGYFQKRKLDLSTEFITKGFGKIKKNIFADSYGEGDYSIVEVTDNPKYIRCNHLSSRDILYREDIVKDNIIKLKDKNKEHVYSSV